MATRLSLETLVQRLEELLPGDVTLEIAQDPKVKEALEAFDPSLSPNFLYLPNGLQRRTSLGGIMR